MSDAIDLLARIQSLEKKVEWMHRQLDSCQSSLTSIRDNRQQREEKNEKLLSRVKALEEAFKYAVPSDLWPVRLR